MGSEIAFHHLERITITIVGIIISRYTGTFFNTWLKVPTKKIKEQHKQNYNIAPPSPSRHPSSPPLPDNTININRLSGGVIDYPRFVSLRIRRIKKEGGGGEESWEKKKKKTGGQNVERRPNERKSDPRWKLLNLVVLHYNLRRKKPNHNCSHYTNYFYLQISQLLSCEDVMKVVTL